MVTLIRFLIILVVFASCGSIKKAQRKARRADKLLKEAGMLAPSIMDTIFITKRDTIVLTKDSLVTKVRLTLDTVKVDSLIDELVELRSKGLETKTVTKLIYEEILPDLTYTSKDSIPITVDEKVRWLRFSISVNIRDDELVIITKPLDNVEYTVEKAVVSIDAVRKNWWQDWKFWVIAAIIAAFFMFKEALMTWIKSISGG